METSITAGRKKGPTAPASPHRPCWGVKRPRWRRVDTNDRSTDLCPIFSLFFFFLFFVRARKELRLDARGGFSPTVFSVSPSEGGQRKLSDLCLRSKYLALTPRPFYLPFVSSKGIISFILRLDTILNESQIAMATLLKVNWTLSVFSPNNNLRL